VVYNRLRRRCWSSVQDRSSHSYWCYDHRNRNRNRFFNWKSNRIEIVFFVHPVKRFVQCPLKHWIAYRRRHASKDHTLQRGRSSVINLFICRRRLPLGWSEREWGGGRVLFLDKQGPPTG